MENDPSVDEGNANFALLAQAAVTEHALTPLQTMRKHWRAFLWCNFMCVGALSWGYSLQGSTELLSVRGCVFALPANWNTAFNIVNAIGSMFGGLSLGWISDRFGRRGGVSVASIVSIVGATIQFVAPTHGILLVGFLINGFASGMFISCAIGYCAEVSPLTLRGITTTAVSLWTVLGQFMFSGLTQGSNSPAVVYPHGLRFALQWIFPLVLLIGLPFVPESPWWLVRKGRYAAAERALAHLGGPTVNVTFQRQKIQETIKLEDSHTATSTYIDCFRGENLRRTVVAVMVFVVQQVAGMGFVSWFSTYCFWTSQFNSSMSCDCHHAEASFASTQVLGNLLTFWTVNRFGRRFLFKWGMAACASACLVIGVTSLTNLWAAFAFIIIYNFFSQASIGPLGYVLSAEVPSAKLRFKTVGIGICANSLCVTLISIAISYTTSSVMIIIWPIIFGVLGFASIIWAHFFIPETKGWTVDQLDLLYAKRVPAKNFASYRLQYDRDEG